MHRILHASLPVLFLIVAASPLSAADIDRLTERQQKLDSALERVTPALVSVQDGFGAGSGVVVSPDGIVLTASHVVDERAIQPRFVRGRRIAPRAITIVFPDGARFSAKVLGMNRFADAAMLKITESWRKGSEFPHVKLGRSSELNRGDWCFALGHPGGFRKDRPAPVRLGRVLSIGHRMIVSDCAIVLGDSGGPLFDLSGQLIGIHSMITEIIVENRHVAVDVFRRDGKRMEAGDSWGQLQAEDNDLVESRFFGTVLRWRSFTPEVSHVLRRSPAEEAGIRPGDILLKVADEPFADPLGLSALLGQRKEQETIKVTVDRNGDEVELTLMTGYMPSKDELKEIEEGRTLVEDRDHFLELKNQLTSLRRVGPYEKRTPEELSLFSSVLESHAASVVEFREFGETLAFGTVMSSDGYILTKASELDGALNPEVLLSNGRRLKMEEVAVDRTYDLMLVKVPATNLTPVEWASDEAKAGRIVITADSRGEPMLPGVISVASRSLKTSQKGFLGVQMVPSSMDRNRRGVLIRKVIPGGAAERHGIEEGDRVLSIRGETLAHSEHMARKIAAIPPYSEVPFRVLRGDTIKTIDIILTPRFIEEQNDQMLGRYRDTENLGKYASRHNSGFPDALQHDTDLFPHQCGGPLFDISGKAVGLNIARAARITSYALPADAVQKVFEQLKVKGAKKQAS